MIGKLGVDKPYGRTAIESSGGVIQYKDTDFQAAHMLGENDKYLGIEFQSRDNSDPLTKYQLEMGRILIDWLCNEHDINCYGPPPIQVVRTLNRNFHGILNHADIQKGRVAGAITDHGDRLTKQEFVALGVSPYPLMLWK